MTGSGENRPRLNSENAWRAAQRPERPGEKCGADPDFLYAAPDTTTCAAFIKESRMNFASANQLHRKSWEAGASLRTLRSGSLSFASLAHLFLGRSKGDSGRRP